MPIAPTKDGGEHPMTLRITKNETSHHDSCYCHDIFPTDGGGGAWCVPRT
jgi:hypothetical protein